jgi:hypothetical protein
MTLDCRICGRKIVVQSYILILVGPPNESHTVKAAKWHLCLLCGESFARHMNLLRKQREVLVWLVRVNCGVSKGGGIPEADECHDALNAAKAALHAGAEGTPDA